jgi:UDP-N-acetylglucosamine:LPS N-acetylglucosamine transferase
VKKRRSEQINVLIAATLGGHLTEALLLFDGIPDVSCSFFTESTQRLTDRTVYSAGPVDMVSWRATSRSFFRALWVLLRHRPDWVVSTGAEVGVGAILAAKVLWIPTIFVETVTRYKDTTRSAKICYRLVNHLYVQHRGTLELMGPKAEYIGGIL